MTKTAIAPAWTASQELTNMTRPRASVIVVNYNGGAALERCLDSLVRDSAADTEIILVDNNSTDGSAARAAERFPQIRLVASSENLGFGGGNNLGAHYAAGEYLAFLNPDTVVEPGWLEALVQALEEDLQAGMATARILLREQPNTINTCGNDVHLSGLTLCRGMGKPLKAYDTPAKVGAVSGAAFVIRRKLFERLGGFDASFFLYMEDTDLSLRARLAGWHILYVPEAVVYHDYWLRFGLRKTYYQERNRYLILLKSLRWPTLVVLLPALLLAEVVTWGFVLLHDRANWENKLRAYHWVVTHWPEVMRRRKETQALREVSDRELLRQTSYRLDYAQASSRGIAYATRLVFDPLFFLWWHLTLALIWW